LASDRAPQYERAKLINPEIEPWVQFATEGYLVKHLRVSRVLASLRSMGFTGGRSALYRRIEEELKPRREAQTAQAFQPYETRPGEQMQFDWAEYRVLIGEGITRIHRRRHRLALAVTLFPFPRSASRTRPDRAVDTRGVAVFEKKSCLTSVWRHPILTMFSKTIWKIMPVQLRDVAKRLKLSITTVSRALDGYDDVAATTRARVLRAAREMEYVPSRAARQLRRNRSEVIGYVLPASAGHFADSFFSEFIAGLGDGAATRGFDLLVSTAAADSVIEKRNYTRWIRSRLVKLENPPPMAVVMS